MTWSGVQFGCRDSSVAAAPDTMGAANDVPDIHMYDGSSFRSGNVVASRELSGTGPLSTRPGAASSGFRNPSWVGPQADQGAAKSSLDVAVPLVSAAPTVITNGSFAGAKPTPLSAPPTA